MSSRPGKGSRVPKNVKLRPNLPIEEQVKPRGGASSSSSGWAVIPRHDRPDWEEDEDEETRRANEDFRYGVEERKPLEGMIVCTTGSLELTREDIRQSCAALGAKLDTSLRTDTTFLIADRTEGDKYKAAVGNGIPVLHSHFLRDLHNQWTSGKSHIDVQALSEARRLAPLHELTICLTGYDDLMMREDLRDKVSYLGGAAYSPQFSSEVTHLVVGPKFSTFEEAVREPGKVTGAIEVNRRRARTSNGRKVHIVWGEWLEHSLLAFGRLKEEEYSVEIMRLRPRQWAQSWKRADQDIVTRQAALSKLTGRSRSDSHKPSHKVLRHDTLLSMGPDANSSSRPGSALAGASNKRSRAGSAAGDDEEESVTVTSTRQQKVQKVAATDRNSDRVLQSGLLDEVQSRERRAVSAQPSTSATTSSKVTLKKSRSTATADLLGVQDLLLPRRAESATPSLAAPTDKGKEKARDQDEDLGEEPQRPPAGTSLLAKISKDRLSKMNSASTSASSSTTPHSATSTIPGTGRADSVTRRMDHATLEVEGDDEDPPSPIFEGKSFLLSFPGVASTLIAGIKDCIVDRGGTIARQDGSDVDYIVTKTIQTDSTSCDLNDPRVRTDVWLEACSFYDRLVELDDHFSIFFTPIRYWGPIQDASRYCISYAGFDAFGDTIVSRFCKTFGLKHEKVLRKNETTHLIIPDSGYTSKRLGAARAWGIDIVFPVWFRELAESKASAQTAQQTAALSARAPDQDTSMDDVSLNVSRIDASTEMTAAPLQGCTVCICPKLENRSSLSKLAERLGASLSYSVGPDSPATHFVYQSRRSKDASREYKTAIDAGKLVVHPAWLVACETAGERVHEGAFKHTYNETRSLQVLMPQNSSTNLDSLSRRDPSKSEHASTTDIPCVAAEDNHSVEGAEEDEEFVLPPPLKRADDHSRASKAAASAVTHSTPRAIRSPMPPHSPSSKRDRSSSATLPSSQGHDLSDALGDVMQDAQPDDSGYGTSSDVRIPKNKEQPEADSDLSSSSPGSKLLQFQERLARSTTAAPSLQADKTSSPASRTLLADMDIPSHSSVTRDLMAEMQALMEAEAKLPDQMQRHAGRSGRRALGKKVATPSFSPARAKSVGFLEAGLLARQQEGYNSVFESQLAGLHQGGLDTQDLHASSDDSTMMIRINDPVAEATRARLLAGLRKDSASTESGEATASTEHAPPRRTRGGREF